MSPELRSAVCFAIAVAGAYSLTPLAIRVAVRLSFYDQPAGYKGHRRPTPYLGGSAIIAGLLLPALALGGSLGRVWALLSCAVMLWVLGTVDDRLGLPVAMRVAVEVAVAVLLWAAGDGWHIAAAVNLPLTVVWVVGVLNAFNLMDNMDGAAATTATVSALGAGTLSLLSGRHLLAPMCFALAGACCGFLPRNLARPARVFMGDGGSLPIGLLVAGLTMSVVTREYLGPRGVVIGALMVGLVILDTALVTFSRTRGGRPVLTGGRDHLTHRLVGRLGSPQAVAMALAASQLTVCAIAIGVAQAGTGWVLLAGGVALAFGAALIWQLERTTPGAARIAVSIRDVQAAEARPERAAA